MSQALINAIQSVKKENNELTIKVASLEERLEKLEQRKKPGPKPRKNNG